MHTTITLLSLAVAALAAPSAEKGVYHISIPTRSIHHADGSIDHEWLLHHVNHTLKKYGSQKLLPSYNIDFGKMHERRAAIAASTKSVGTVPLSDSVYDYIDDELFYGNVITGTGANAQTWQIDFDTGSSDFFVPGPNCSTTQGCYGTQRYNQMGTSEGNMTEVAYGSGLVAGDNYLDTITVGGIQVTKTNVVSLITAAGFNGPNNGLMGMAFYDIASSDTMPFFYQAMNQKKVKANEFAFQLGRAVSNTANKGALTLGGVNTKSYTGPFNVAPVSDRGYWQVTVESLNVNHTTAGITTAGQAAIDTGTTLVLGPTAAIAPVYEQIPGAVPLPLGGVATLWAVPCSTFNTTSFGFVFAGLSPGSSVLGGTQELGINPLDMNFGPLADAAPVMINGTVLYPTVNNATAGMCLSALGSADLDPTHNLYIIGDSFIKNWYTVFSFNNYQGGPSVSFARSTLNNPLPPKKKGGH